MVNLNLENRNVPMPSGSPDLDEIFPSDAEPEAVDRARIRRFCRGAPGEARLVRGRRWRPIWTRNLALLMGPILLAWLVATFVFMVAALTAEFR
jgi:hypothetical protein